VYHKPYGEFYMWIIIPLSPPNMKLHQNLSSGLRQNILMK